MIQIYLETFSQGFKETSMFISKIAESKSRQEFLQRFEINAGSLYAAVTLGLDHTEICEGLRKYSKFEWVDPHAERWIQKTADSYGKCRLVLENNRYYIESPFRAVVQYYFDLEYLKASFIGEVFQVEKGGQIEEEVILNRIEEENENEEDEWQFEDHQDNGNMGLKKNDIIEETQTDIVTLKSRTLHDFIYYYTYFVGNSRFD